MPSIFVSYRRSDAPGHAGRLYDRLVSRFGEANVYKDVDSMKPGADFTEVIERTIERCDAMVVVIGRGWLETEPGSDAPRIDDPRDWVRIELARALRREIPVVPVLVAGAVMPTAETLPEDIRALTRRHAVALTEATWTPQVDQLLETLNESDTARGKRTRQAAPVRTKPLRARAGSSPRRRWTIALTATLWMPLVSLGYGRADRIASLVGAVVGLLLAAFLFLGSTSPDATLNAIGRFRRMARTSSSIGTTILCWLLIAAVSFITAAILFGFIDPGTTVS
jgi:hypothetical protein